MKTWLKITLGLVGAGAVGGTAFLVLKPKRLSPYEKFAKDAFDPNTQAGAEIMNYLSKTNTYTQENITNVVNTHSSPSFPSHIYAGYKAQESWKADDVVRY